MSMVKDLRAALQDMVAPDLTAVVQGLNELRSEVREGNTLLRAEIQAAEKRSTGRLDKTELRLTERLERVYDTVKIADLTRRNSELEAAMDQLRKSQQASDTQQH